MKRYTHFLITFVVLIIVCSSLNEVQAALTAGETGGFTVDENKLPIKAWTKFYEAAWADEYKAKWTAQHELLHAIGWAGQYDLFKDHVPQYYDTGNQRSFYQNKKDPRGGVLAVLTPYGASGGDHIRQDLAGQEDSIMRAGYAVAIKGKTMGPFEKQILDAAFDWSTLHLDITVTFTGFWSVAQKAIVNDAATAAEDLFGGGGSHAFTWTVIPEPGTITLLALGGLALLRRSRRRVHS